MGDNRNVGPPRHGGPEHTLQDLVDLEYWPQLEIGPELMHMEWLDGVNQHGLHHGLSPREGLPAFAPLRDEDRADIMYRRERDRMGYEYDSAAAMAAREHEGTLGQVRNNLMTWFAASLGKNSP